MAAGDEENMSVQGEGEEEYRPPDEEMQSSVSSGGNSRIVADYERKFQQLKTEHENELRLRGLQAAKNIDMLQKRVKQELEDSEYVKEMEEKKKLTLAALKDAEKLNQLEFRKIKILDLKAQKIRNKNMKNLIHHNQNLN